MQKTFIIISIILLLVVLGCTLPIETGRQTPQRPTPETEKSTDSGETEKLREKIAELEKEKFEEKIAELEKKVDNKKTQTIIKTVPQTKTKTKTKKPPKGYARVSSPGDGWLALRTGPSTKTGSRILKILHGTRLRIYSCTGVRSSGRLRGRWCRTAYSGYEGWVFDYYLIR